MMKVTRTDMSNALSEMGATITQATVHFLFEHMGGRKEQSQIDVCETTLAEAFDAWARIKNVPNYNSTKAATIMIHHMSVAQGYPSTDLPYVGD